jgi:hypothetical protein
LVQSALFVSAYSPLLVLLAILRSFGSGAGVWVCLGLAAVGVALSMAFWRVALRQPIQWQHATHSRPRDGEVLNFFVAYVVPFAAAPLDDARARTALIFFLLVLAVLYTRAGLYQVHPLLLLCGYHLYELDLTDGSTVMVLTSRPFLPQTQTLKVVPLMPNVFVERP